MATDTKIKSNVSQVVPFLMITDMERSLLFYTNGLGFEMTNKWIDEGRLRWCWLQLGAAALMLQEIKKEGHDSWIPGGQMGIGVSIYFICEDALAIYKEIKSKGIQAKKPFVGNSMWVTGVSDPDGYELFFESPTNEAEETVFSE